MTIKEFIESKDNSLCLVTPFTTVEDAETFVSNFECLKCSQYFEEHSKFTLSKGKVGMFVYIYRHGAHGVVDLKVLDNEGIDYRYLTYDNPATLLLQKLNKGY